VAVWNSASRPSDGLVANPFGDNVVSLEWDLNGTSILTESFNSAPARTMQEIVGKNLLNAQATS
jgi:hypothetical protein